MGSINPRTVSFAEMDGPFSAGIGSDGLEKSCYAVVFYDEDDCELGTTVYSNWDLASRALFGLKERGIEVSCLCGG